MPWLLSNAVRAGQLVRVMPQTYVDPQFPGARPKAALRYLAGRGGISHISALDAWRIGWSQPRSAPIHVMVDPSVHLRGAPGLVIHRRADFHVSQLLRRAGLLVTPVATTLVDSWPLLPEADRIGLLIDAVIEGHTTVEALRHRLDATPRLTRAAELRRLLDLVAKGCRSPLELWGALHVFTGPGMPEFRRQYRAGKYLLDLFAEAARIAFELDGAAFHGDRAQRERDLRRDAALAALGIHVVRFSYARLKSEPDTVRREVLKILAARQS